MAQAPVLSRPLPGLFVPEVRVKYSAVPADLMDRLKSYNPKSDVFKLFKTALRYLPSDLALELIDRFAGVVVVESELWQKVIRGDTGKVEDYGLVSRKVITTAGVDNIVDVWGGAGTALSSWKYIGIGTGTAAEDIANTDLTTELTTEYNPNSTRVTGTVSEAAHNQIQIVGTNTIDSGSPVLRETGLFTSATVGAGVLWDRFLYAAITLVGANGDGLQSTIKALFTAGG